MREAAVVMRAALLLCLPLAAAACGHAPANKTSAAAGPASATLTQPATAATTAPPTPASAEASVNASASPPAKPAQPAHPGKDFGDAARALYRIAACAGDAALPPDLDAKLIKAHCDELAPKLEKYKEAYVAPIRGFLSGVVPQGSPRTVVYPFGGGDLATALTTYPDASEINTLSLELVGDPRRARGMKSDALERSLRLVRRELSELFIADDYSKSETLKRTQRGDIPGELVFFLVALAVHGDEPVSLRYFRVEEGGSLHYFDEAEIDALLQSIATHRKASWTPPDFSEAFANSELTFRARGAGEGAPLRVHRHFAANLADDHLKKDPSLLRYLESRGRVSAMTKAASYLLWNDGFSMIRGYLLDHMEIMLSDSTGIPPAFASEKGFVQETYGTFKGSLLMASPKHNAAFKKLWASEPKRPFPYRYGYHDNAGAFHLLVTRRAPRSS